MREITGRHVLIFTVAAFSVIIAVNLTLAWQAVRTFPGLVTGNSYVASQKFDDDRAAQLALGWTVRADYSDGVLSVSVVDDGGAPAEVREFYALVGWATSTRDDRTPEFTRNGAAFSTPLDLDPGNWNVRIKAIAPDGTEFRQRIPLRVKG